MDTSSQDQLNKTNLYDEDFYSWTQQQAALLRAGRLDRADLANIVEEIETLGRSELSFLRSSYRLVILHFLKMIHQPSHSGGSWHATIVRERGNIEELLADNPGLKPKRGEAVDRAYSAARREAASETGLAIEMFPERCPFALEQIEQHAFWPEAPTGGGTARG